MLFLFGSYGRNRPLGSTTDACPYCQRTTAIHWVRTYRTGHFFFFPLFSYGERIVGACGACGGGFDRRYPGPLPPMPFLDRLGFLVPIGAVGAVFVAFMMLVASAVATAPPPRPATAESSILTRLQTRARFGVADGAGAGGDVIADDVMRAFTGDQGEGFAKSDVAVSVHVKEGEPRMILVACKYAHLKELADVRRTGLAETLHGAIAPHMQGSDHAVVLVAGMMFTGVLVYGDSTGEWSVETKSVIPPDDIEKAIQARSAAGGAADARAP